MHEVLLEYSGVEYRCRVTYDVAMHIENKVVLTELAERVVSGNTPNSHVVWCLYCLLRAAGAPVATAGDVWEEVKHDRVEHDTIVSVLHFIIEEVFGVGPTESLSDEGGEDVDTEKKTAPSG